MKKFNYYQPTEIRFGWNRLNEVGEIVAKYGSRCLLVTMPPFPEMEPIFDKVKSSLKAADVDVKHFDGVVPNPTTACVSSGANMAKEYNVEVVLGVGGGSTMDTAKAIAVEATHEGTCWDYLWFRETQPTTKTLPVIVVTTTSGTGSHVTQVAVVTNPSERCKSAIYNPIIYPRVGIVSPELMLTMPEHVTALTGFDVLAHAFESYIHSNGSPYTDMMAKEAIRLVHRYLPIAVKDGSNKDARSAMAWADTLAGLCIANAGVTLPHGMGMAMGGMYPHLEHGKTLAAIYPAFMRYTYKSAIEQFAMLSRIFNEDLKKVSDNIAAEKSCEEIENFLKEIGLWFSLEELGVPEDELPELAEACMVLPDYKNNPRVATLDEVMKLLKQSYIANK